MSKTLVTGGSGFIGASLVRALLKQGREVRVLDNNFRGKTENLDSAKGQIEFVQADIRDERAVREALKGIDSVFHLAFVNGTEFFYKEPKLVLEVGLKGALNVMDASVSAGVKNFIYASSSEVYQEAREIPTPENVAATIPDVQNPRYSYGTGKLTGELLTLHYLPKEMKRIIFRPHNIYGPAMGWEHVVPQLIKKLYERTHGFEKKEASLPIQGTGTETRAFCYVDDATEGILICESKGKSGEVYHIGKDEEISIRGLIQEIGELLNLKISIESGELQKGSTPRRCPDITKMKNLGYAPKVSLREGLEKTIAWYSKNLKENLCHK